MQPLRLTGDVSVAARRGRDAAASEGRRPEKLLQQQRQQQQLLLDCLADPD